MLIRGREVIVDQCDEHLLAAHDWVIRGSGRRENRHLEYVGFIPQPGSVVLLHRLITNCPDHLEVDHKDGNGLNNSRQNLRVCTHLQNLQNRRKHCKSSSVYKGVYWESAKGRWRTQIVVNGKKIRKYWSSESDAARHYDELAAQHFGEFARLNFSEEMAA